MFQRNLTRKFSQRAVAFLIACAFSANSVLFGAPELLQNPIRISSAELKITIPAELGKVDDQFLPEPCLQSPSDCPLVVYLQDAHANLGAQQNIQKIARLLSNQLKINTILLEGASGEARLDSIRSLADQTVKDLVTRFWLREVIVTGIEAEAITSPLPYRLIGIEDQSLYEKNVSEFNRTFRQSKAALEILNPLIRELELLREGNDNSGLKEFEKKVSSYEKKSELIQLVSYLWNLGRELGVKRSDLGFVEKLISLIILEKSIASAKESSDSEKLEFQKLISEIGARELFGELSELRSRIRERLYQSAEERERFLKLSYLKNLKSVFSLQATPDDIRFFNEHQKELQLISKKAGLDSNLFAEASNFYRTSTEREQAFLLNVRKQVAAGNKTFLVTGGFHTDNLKEQFRSLGIPFVTIAPGISEETNYERYYERLSGERPDFGKFESKFSDFIKESTILFEPFTFRTDFVPVARQFFEAVSARSELRAKDDQGKNPKRPLRGGLDLPDWVGKAFPTVAWLFGGTNEVVLKGGKNLRVIVHGTVMLFKTNNFESAAYSLDSPWHTEAETVRAVVVEKENFETAIRQAKFDLMNKPISRQADQLIRQIEAEIEEERMSADYLIERVLKSNQTNDDVVQFAKLVQSHLRQPLNGTGMLGKALLENEIEFFRSAIGLIIASYRKQIRDLMKKGQSTEAEKLGPLIIFFENLKTNIIALMEKEKRSARDILIEYADPQAVDKLTRSGKEIPLFVKALNDFRTEMNNTSGTEDERKKREQIILSYKEFFSDLYHLLSTLRHSGILRYENQKVGEALKDEQTELFLRAFQRINFAAANDQLAGLPEEFSIDKIIKRLKEDTVKNIRNENLYAEFAFQSAGHRLLDEIDRRKAKSPDTAEMNLLSRLSGFIENMLSEMSGPLSRKFAAQKQFLEAKNLIVVTQEMSAVVFLKLHEVYPNLKVVVAYEGSPAEHWAIYASGHGILSITPIISIEGKKANIKSGNEAFADGESGELVVNARDPKKFEEKRIREKVLLEHALKSAKKPVLATKRGLPEIAVTVGGNAAPHLDSNERARQLSELASATERIDLFRTEFGIPFNFVPGVPVAEAISHYEDSLTQQLVDAGKALPEGVVMRTIDRQPDKEISGIPSSAKGYGLDFYFDDPIGAQVLRAQLRAAIRAYRVLKRRAARKRIQVGNPIRVLFPMLKTKEEAEKLIAVWDEVSSEFIKNRALPKERRVIPLGFMIETNEAIQNLDLLLDKRKIDFVSIGTNDLTKETFGKFDRKGEEFSLLQPKVLERIELVAQKAASQGIKVTVCGDLGGWRRFALFAVYLAGKYDVRFGLAASSIARLKNLIRFTHYEEVRDLFADYTSIDTVEGIRAFNNRITQKVKEIEDRIVENANSFSEDSQIVSIEEPVTSTFRRKDDEGIIQIEVPDQASLSGVHSSPLSATEANTQAMETILSEVPDEVTVPISNYRGLHASPGMLLFDIATSNLFATLSDEEGMPAIQVNKVGTDEWLSVRDMLQVMMLFATQGSHLTFRIQNAKTPEQKRAKLIFFLAMKKLIVDVHFGEALAANQTDPGMPTIAEIMSDAEKAVQSGLAGSLLPEEQIASWLAGAEFKKTEARSELRANAPLKKMLGYEPLLTEKQELTVSLGQWIWVAHPGKDRPEFAQIRFVKDEKDNSKLRVEIQSKHLGGIKPSWYTSQDEAKINRALDEVTNQFVLNANAKDFSFLLVRRHLNHKKEHEMMVFAELNYEELVVKGDRPQVRIRILHSKTTHVFGHRQTLGYEITIRRIFAKVLHRVNANPQFTKLINSLKTNLEQTVLIRLVLLSIHDPFYRNLLINNLWLYSEIADSAPVFSKILEHIQKALLEVVKDSIEDQHSRYVINEHVINYLNQMYHLVREFDPRHRKASKANADAEKTSQPRLPESMLEITFRRMIIEVWRVFFDHEIARATGMVDEISKALKEPGWADDIDGQLDRLKKAEVVLEKAAKYLHRIKTFYSKIRIGYIFQHEDLDLGILWSRINTYTKRILAKVPEGVYIWQQLTDLESRSRHERTFNYRESTREGGLLPIDVILDIVGFAVAERQPRKIAYSWLFRLINKKKMHEITGLGGRINHVATASLLALYQLGTQGEVIGREIEEKLKTGKRQDVMDVFIQKVRVHIKDAEVFDSALSNIEAHFAANPSLDSDNRRGYVLKVYRDLLNVKWMEGEREYKPFPKEDPRLALLLLYLSGALGDIEKKRATATDMEPELRAVVQNLLERDVLGRVIRRKGHVSPEDVEHLMRHDRWLSKHLRGTTRRIFKDYLHKLGLVRDEDRFPSILKDITKLFEGHESMGLVMFDRHAPLEPTRDAVAPLSTHYKYLVAFYGWATHTQPLGESWSVANGVRQLADRMAQGEKVLGDLFSPEKQMWFGRMHQKFSAAVLEGSEKLREEHFAIAKQSEGRVGQVMNTAMNDILNTLINEEARNRMTPEEVAFIDSTDPAGKVPSLRERAIIEKNDRIFMELTTDFKSMLPRVVRMVSAEMTGQEGIQEEFPPPSAEKIMEVLHKLYPNLPFIVDVHLTPMAKRPGEKRAPVRLVMTEKARKLFGSITEASPGIAVSYHEWLEAAENVRAPIDRLVDRKDFNENVPAIFINIAMTGGRLTKLSATDFAKASQGAYELKQALEAIHEKKPTPDKTNAAWDPHKISDLLLDYHLSSKQNRYIRRIIQDYLEQLIKLAVERGIPIGFEDPEVTAQDHVRSLLDAEDIDLLANFRIFMEAGYSEKILDDDERRAITFILDHPKATSEDVAKHLGKNIEESDAVVEHVSRKIDHSIEQLGVNKALRPEDLIESLKLPWDIYESLRNAGISTISDLRERKVNDLMKIEGITRVKARTIRSALKQQAKPDVRSELRNTNSATEWSAQWGKVLGHPQYIEEWVKRHAGKLGDVVVEIAPSAFPATASFKEKRVLMIDIASPQSVNQVSANHILIQGDIEHPEAISDSRLNAVRETLQVRDSNENLDHLLQGQVDSIILPEILNYVDYQKVIDRIIKWLKPGGRLFIMNMPNYGLNHLFSEKRPQNNRELLEFIKSKGFTTESLEPDADERKMSDTLFMWLIARKAEPARSELRRDEISPDVEAAIARTDYKVVLTDLANTLISDEPGAVVSTEIAGLIEGIRSLVKQVTTATGRDLDSTMRTFTDLLSPYARSGQFLYTEGGSRASRFDKRGELKEKPVYVKSIDEEKFLGELTRLIEDSWREVVAKSKSIDAPIEQHDLLGRTLMLKLVMPNNSQAVRNEVSDLIRSKIAANPKFKDIKVYPSPRSITITRADKGNAAKHLVKAAKAKPNEVLIIGDSELDDPMFRSIGGATKIYVGETPYPNMPADVIHFPIHGPKGTQAILQLIFKAMFQEFKRHVKVAAATEQSIEFNERQPVSQNEERWVNGDYVDANEEWMQAGIVMVMNRLQQELGLNLYDLAKSINVSDILKLADVAGDEEFVKNFIAFGAARRTWKFMAAGEDFKTTSLIGMYGDGDVRWLEETVGETAEIIRKIGRQTNHPIKDHWNDKGEPYTEFIASLRALPEPVKQAMRELIRLPYHLGHNMGLVEWYFRDHHLKMLDLFWLNGIIPPKNLASVATSGVLGQPKGTVGAPLLDVVDRAINSEEEGAKILFTVAPERFPVVDAFYYLRSGLPHLKDGEIRNLENLWKLKVRAADGSMRRLDFDSTREFLKALPEDEAPVFNVVGQWNYTIFSDSVRIEHLKTGQVINSSDPHLHAYFVNLVYRALVELYANGMVKHDLGQFKPNQDYWDFLNGVLQSAMRGRNGLNLMEVTAQAIALNVVGYRIFLNRADNEVYIVPPGQLPGIIPSDLTEWFLTQISFGIAYSNTAVKDIKAMVTALPAKDQLFQMFDETMRLSQDIGEQTRSELRQTEQSGTAQQLRATRAKSELREFRGMPLAIMSDFHRTLSLDLSDLPIEIEFNGTTFGIAPDPNTHELIFALPNGSGLSVSKKIQDEKVSYEVERENRATRRKELVLSVEAKGASALLRFNTSRNQTFFVVATERVNLRDSRGQSRAADIQIDGLSSITLTLQNEAGHTVDSYELIPDGGNIRIVNQSGSGRGTSLPAGFGSIEVNEYFAVSNFGNGYLLIERLFQSAPDLRNIQITWSSVARSELRDNLAQGNPIAPSGWFAPKTLEPRAHAETWKSPSDYANVRVGDRWELNNETFTVEGIHPEKQKIQYVRDQAGELRVLKFGAWKGEAELLHAVHGVPNLLQGRVLVQGEKEKGNWVLLLDFAGGKALADYTVQSFDKATRIEMLLEIIKALKAIREKGFILYDVKPGNVVINLVESKPHATVVDFGGSVKLSDLKTSSVGLNAEQKYFLSPVSRLVTAWLFDEKRIEIPERWRSLDGIEKFVQSQRSELGQTSVSPGLAAKSELRSHDTEEGSEVAKITDLIERGHYKEAADFSESHLLLYFKTDAFLKPDFESALKQLNALYENGLSQSSYLQGAFSILLQYRLSMNESTLITLAKQRYLTRSAIIYVLLYLGLDEEGDSTIEQYGWGNDRRKESGVGAVRHAYQYSRGLSAENFAFYSEPNNEQLMLILEFLRWRYQGKLLELFHALELPSNTFDAGKLVAVAEEISRNIVEAARHKSNIDTQKNALETDIQVLMAKINSRHNFKDEERPQESWVTSYEYPTARQISMRVDSIIDSRKTIDRLNSERPSIEKKFQDMLTLFENEKDVVSLRNAFVRLNASIQMTLEGSDAEHIQMRKDKLAECQNLIKGAIDRLDLRGENRSELRKFNAFVAGATVGDASAILQRNTHQQRENISKTSKLMPQPLDFPPIGGLDGFASQPKINDTTMPIPNATRTQNEKVAKNPDSKAAPNDNSDKRDRYAATKSRLYGSSINRKVANNSQIVNNYINISNISGRVIVSVGELVDKPALIEAIKKSITENPNSPIQIAIVAEQFATGVEAEPAVQKLFGDFDIFGKKSGTNQKPRAQLYARDRLGIARELSTEQAYSKLVDLARTELVVASGLTTRIVAIGNHDLLAGVKQKIAKIVSEADSLTMAELLIASDNPEQYLKFADEFGIVSPTAALIDSLVNAILEKALVESAA